MSDPGGSSETPVSEFLESGNKRKPEDDTKSHANKNVALSLGTVDDPVILVGDDTGMAEDKTEAVSEKENSGSVGTRDMSEPSKAKDAADAAPATNANPFACFAYKQAEIPKTTNPPRWKIANIAAPKEKKIPKKSKTSGDSNKKENFVSMKDLPEEEQIRITKKWHSLVDSSASIEVRRFQVLVAARLHARCQEPTVRKAMKSLQDNLNEFTVEAVSKADPEVLALCITNLQFYNSKAKQIVKAANEIMSQFGGEVPEDIKSLLKITGVGKVFADLLAFVNTREVHTKTEPQEDSAV